MHLKPLPKLLQEPYLQALAIQRRGSRDWQSPVTVPSVTIRTMVLAPKQPNKNDGLWEDWL
jgi:hypothetical protein